MDCQVRIRNPHIAIPKLHAAPPSVIFPDATFPVPVKSVVANPESIVSLHGIKVVLTAIKRL